MERGIDRRVEELQKNYETASKARDDARQALRDVAQILRTWGGSGVEKALERIAKEVPSC